MHQLKDNQGAETGCCSNGIEPFIGKPEIARRVNKQVRTVDNWMEQGLLPFYKVGRSVLFKWSEVEKHLRQTCRVCHGDETD